VFEPRTLAFGRTPRIMFLQHPIRWRSVQRREVSVEADKGRASAVSEGPTPLVDALVSNWTRSISFIVRLSPSGLRRELMPAAPAEVPEDCRMRQRLRLRDTLRLNQLRLRTRNSCAARIGRPIASANPSAFHR
jgi:hypothetical protein